MFPELNPGSEIWQAVMAVGAAAALYLAVLWLALVLWTFGDIRRRTRNWFARLLATLFVLVLGLPGMVLYLLLRPKQTLAESYERELEEEALLQDLEERLACPGCQRRVRDDFLVCPHCEARLKDQCQHCGKPLALSWNVCPYCATPAGRRRTAPSTGEERLAPEPAPGG
jgi:hypothetical protein